MLVFVQGIFSSAILIEFGLVISISNHKCPAVLKTLEGKKKSFSIKMIKQTSVRNFSVYGKYEFLLPLSANLYLECLNFTITQTF